MTELVKYEQARLALAQATSVDEVKNIRDQAQALFAYARQAKDTTLVGYVTEIKVRAERRCGEMLRDSAATGQRATKERHGQNAASHRATLTTLRDLNITRDESSRWQKLASIPAKDFEETVAVEKAKGAGVTTAALLRKAKELEAEQQAATTAKSQKPKPENQKSQKAEPKSEPAEEQPSIVDQLRGVNAELIDVNEDLTARLAVAAMEATPEEKRLAADLITELRATVVQLERELRAVKVSRNAMMVENAELKKQVAYWRKRAEKEAA